MGGVGVHGKVLINPRILAGRSGNPTVHVCEHGHCD
jgi:hypothetical protein